MPELLTFSAFFYSYQFTNVNGSIGVVAVLSTAIWGGRLAKQLDYSCDDKPTLKLDFKNHTDFARPFMLYFSYGLLDAMFQSMVYWVIGSLADDFEILSKYTIQSVEAAVAWQIDVHNVPFLTELIVNWVLTIISYPLLAVLVIRAVKDDDEIEGKPKEGAALPGIH